MDVKEKVYREVGGEEERRRGEEGDGWMLRRRFIERWEGKRRGGEEGRETDECYGEGLFA